MTLCRFIPIAIIIMTTSVSTAFSSIQISNTRVIYPATEKNVSILITNPGKYPVLLQSWIDNGQPNAKPDNLRTPFVLTPPLSRVNEGTGQTLRLSFVGPALPVDRESMFWLNVLEIPPVDRLSRNQMQVAFRSRIKLFYRPAGLNDKDAQSAPSQLRWSQQGKILALSNSSPYFVSAVGLTITRGGKKTTFPTEMLSPYGGTHTNLPPGITAEGADSVVIETINDYGATVSTLVQRL